MDHRDTERVREREKKSVAAAPHSCNHHPLLPAAANRALVVENRERGSERSGAVSIRVSIGKLTE